MGLTDAPSLTDAPTRRKLLQAAVQGASSLSRRRPVCPGVQSAARGRPVFIYLFSYVLLDAPLDDDWIPGFRKKEDPSSSPGGRTSVHA